MKERAAMLLRWAAFLSLLLGVFPLLSMAVGYQLEEMQHRPTFGQWQCDQIANEAAHQHTPRADEQNTKAVYETGMQMEAFDPEKCRVAGSGSVTVWVQPEEGMGFIYAKLSERQMLHHLGYRTFFHDLSGSRWVSTALIAAFWLPCAALTFIGTGSLRILPWRK
tara:strand:+ start:1180 stop:1674 length:495 start_codon:yes stop_codon:yes gene_type:complete